MVVRRMKRRMRRRRLIKRRRTRRVPRNRTGNAIRFFKLRRVVNVNAGALSFEDLQVSAVPDFTNIRGLFAWYRVAAMKLTYLPVFSEIIQQPLSQNYIYVKHDWELPPASINEQSMLDSERTRIFSNIRKWHAYFRMKRNIVTVPNNANQLGGSWLPTDAPRATQQLSVFINSNGGPNPQGRIIITYYLAAKYRD